MTPEELRAAVTERFGARVFVREQPGIGKSLVVCGAVAPGGPRKKAYEKSISFNAAFIPDDALDKVEATIR